jgi:hypothetical protein
LGFVPDFRLGGGPLVSFRLNRFAKALDRFPDPGDGDLAIREFFTDVAPAGCSRSLRGRGQVGFGGEAFGVEDGVGLCRWPGLFAK